MVEQSFVRGEYSDDCYRISHWRPFAVVILTTFTIEREEKAALDRVNNLSAVAWYAFRDAVYAMCTKERMDALQEIPPKIEEFHITVLKQYDNWKNGLLEREQPDYRPSWLTNLKQHIEEIEEVIRPWSDAAIRLSHIVHDSESVEVEWAAIVGTWNTLDQFVRLQRLERDLEWFQSTVDVRLRRWLSRPNPLQDFTDVHGTMSYGMPYANTMMDVIHFFGSFASNDDYWRQSWGHQTPHATNYRERYQSALKFLRELRALSIMSSWRTGPKSPTSRSQAKKQVQAV